MIHAAAFDNASTQSPTLSASVGYRICYHASIPRHGHMREMYPFLALNTTSRPTEQASKRAVGAGDIVQASVHRTIVSGV